MKYKSINNKFDNLIINIKDYFNNKTNKTLFKKRNVIKLIEYSSKQYVIKSFKVPHILNKIVYKYFRASKASRSYENSIKLVNLNC